MPDISVIIVNWNSKDYVRQCLISLFKNCQNMSLEVIVVDGGSFDGCDTMLASEFPQVVFIQVKENVGFARANNVGFERATGEYVWLLNPDTEVVGQAAATLLQTLQSSKDIGMVGARLLNSDGSLQTNCVQSLPTPLNQALDSEILRRLFPNLGLWGIVALQSKAEPVEAEAIPGACMLLRREDFARVGCFDPRYFMYAEDMDLCFKIHRAGLKIFYVPKAEVLHHGGGSSRKQFSKFSVVLMREAVTSYLSSNFSIFHAWCYRFCMALSALSRIAALLALRVVARSEENLFSLQKWIAILKWCLGGERWAKAYSRQS